MDTPNLIIDLNVDGAKYFEDANNLLQYHAAKQLSQIIERQLEFKLTDYSPPKDTEFSYTRLHNAILVQGGRGSGKTTFLINVLSYLGKGGDLPKGIKDSFKKLSSCLQVLPSIDPTLIETKEHIIIVIISLIDSALDDPANNPEADRTKVDLARRDMAEGLSLLDGIGKSNAYGDEWEDPEWIMSRGLRKARKGRTFEIKFQAYLHQALKILNKKAFMLAFDDIDTHFKSGFMVLETLRKYLTSPQLVLLISGNLELYGRLIRRNIYDAFGRQLLEHEDKASTSAAIQELEEQYLLKIIPPQNRIAMMSLAGIMQMERSNELQVIPLKSLQPESKPEPQSLSVWASRQIGQHLLENKQGPQHPFFEVIGRQHLRLVLGYLRAIGERELELAQVLTVFESRLQGAGIDSWQLSQTRDQTLRLVFNWLVTQDNPVGLARFGVPSDDNTAIIVHCLALAIAKQLKSSPVSCLRFLFTLSLPISMMTRAAYSSKSVRQQIFQFIWQEASPDFLVVAGRIGAIARYAGSASIGNLRGSCFGSVGTIKKLSIKNAMNQIFDIELVDNIKTVKDLYEILNDNYFIKNYWVEILNNNEKLSAMSAQKGVVWFSLEDLSTRCGSFGLLLDLLTYDRFGPHGEQFRSVSALSLLATIAALLAEKGPLNQVTLRKLALTSTIPAFLVADVAGGVSQPDELDELDELDEEGESNETAPSEFDSFIERMNAWKKFVENDTEAWSLLDDKLNANLAPSQLARVAERIHDQLLSLDDVVSLKWKTGQILHRQITNILHALLVVTSGDSGRLEAPKSSDRSLVEALQRAVKAQKLHPLAIIVLTCPLVWAFLSPHGYEANPNKKNSVNLREEVDKLGVAIGTRSSLIPGFDNSWLVPPELEVMIGRIGTNSSKVKITGFFDLLNQVPRFHASSVK